MIPGDSNQYKIRFGQVGSLVFFKIQTPKKVSCHNQFSGTKTKQKQHLQVTSNTGRVRFRDAHACNDKLRTVETRLQII